ncbi:MAG: hypothetical protein JWM34_2352 [Ilumatobacteraceae bacterium]|nr:hypothetical protein [Ilumatobacteraceae bacterium]
MSADIGERDRLLGLVADYCLEHGVGDLTLRSVGKAVGSNNRMLLYYFGSKEALITSALDAATARYPDLVRAIDLLDEAERPLADRIDDAWRTLSAPRNVVPMRLFFESFGLAAHHPGRFGTYLDIVGKEWTARVTKVLRAEGVPTATARLLGREVVALWRGLQFDLLSTGERAAIDATHRAAARSIADRAAAAR